MTVVSYGLHSYGLYLWPLSGVGRARACSRSARIDMAYIVMAYTVIAYVVMTYKVMTYVVMAYTVMAYIVMAYVSYGLYSYIVMASVLRGEERVPAAAPCASSLCRRAAR